MVRCLRFRIEEEEELNFPSSENEGADQLRGNCKAGLRFCFRLGKIWFSHDAAHAVTLGVGWLSGKVSEAKSRGHGPEVIKLFSCSAQLRLKFILLINVKMPKIVGILTFISRINYRFW